MRLLQLFATSVFLLACTPAAPQGTATPSPTTEATPPAATAPGPASPRPTRPPAGTAPLPTPSDIETPPGAVGEVPTELLEPLIEQAAQLAGVEPVEVAVLRAEQVRWPDGSLGCPEPGQPYTQEPVDGYWVVLQAGDQTYDFRLGEAGTPRLCPAGGGRPALPSPDPDG